MGGLAFKTLGGEGDDIVLIHGFGSERLSWLATSPALMSVGKVHALDLPGHGDSSLDTGDGSPQVLSAQIHDLLLAKGITRSHLVGHSLGGGLALLLAANHSERVTSLTVIAPAGLGTGVDRAFLAAYPELRDADEALALLRRLVATPVLINKMTVQRVLTQFNRKGARVALRLIASQLVGNEPGLAVAAEAVAARATPRFVVWGERDTVNPPDNHRIQAFGGNTLLVPNAAHLPHIENPKLVNEALVAFLKQHVTR